MHRIFEPAHFSRELVSCSKCGWRGRGSDLVTGEFLFMTDATELFCPDCNAYLGFLNGTAEEDEEEGRRERWDR